MPEFAAIHLEPRQVLDINVHESVLDYEEAACRIEHLCQCAARDANPNSSTNAPLCLILIVESVISMLWPLSLVEFDRNLRLHKFGVRKVCERWESTQLDHEVYKCHSRRRLGRLLQYLTLATLQDAIRDLFTAPLNLHENKENSWDCSSAYSSYGICVFFKLVVELIPQPEQVSGCKFSQAPLLPSLAYSTNGLAIITQRWRSILWADFAPSPSLCL